ncbi:hypothetical protein BJX63DRAFT_428696 [Aspergillus granulosus]|uniref:Suppressor of anucleate metulae protein B n=1 Tax=Aspergillus granulosus TaxID=176169 RepID=A0ABR4HVG8_9EURO
MAVRGVEQTSPPRRDGSARPGNTSGEDELPASKKAMDACANCLRVFGQDCGPDRKNGGGQQQDNYQTPSRNSLRGALLTRPKHARKRSYSLPTDLSSKNERHKARSEAVTLLRARTVSRLSDSDRPAKGMVKGCWDLILNLNLPPASDRGPGQPITENEPVEVPKTPNIGQTQTNDLVSSTLSPERSSPIPMKEKLTPVREGWGKRGSVTSESSDFRISTPNSTGTASSHATSWTTSPYSAILPHTPAAADLDTGHHGKQGRTAASYPVAIAPSTPFSQVQVRNTHVHPSPASASAITRDIQTRRGQRITTQKPEGFFWQLDSHGFPCAKADCDGRCNLWDGATVICPRCGPYSETRYCSREHLLKDVKAHWAICGQNTFQHPCRESTIPKDVRDGPPMIPCLHPYDTPERHRQALYFNMHSSAGDYFIFSDWIDMVEAGFPDDHLRLRCSNRIVHVVKFTDPSEKDRFRRVLAACLFVTLESHELTDYLFRLIRDKLRSTALPPTTSLSTLQTSLKYQLHQETAVTIQPAITGERHACEADWTGTSRHNCPDPICRSEYRRLLGALGRRGQAALVEYLEGSYWILRAARTLHPNVKDVRERMKGEGFGDVTEEYRRVFCRGDGWDGAGAGDIEIEGVNA